MKTRIVCLANSYKEGGRCVAGIELNSNNEIVEKDLMPKWIRPVCKTKHDEIPFQLVSNLKPLDIIEFHVTEPIPKGFQTENVLFDEKSLKIIGEYEKENIHALGINCRKSLFGNNGKAIQPENSGYLSHSLMLISVNKFEIIEVKFAECEHPKFRLKFKYLLFENDLSITDPIFIDKYKKDRMMLKNVKELFLVVSLGIKFEGWHSKLVACIIY